MYYSHRLIKADWPMPGKMYRWGNQTENTERKKDGVRGRLQAAAKRARDAIGEGKPQAMWQYID